MPGGNRRAVGRGTGRSRLVEGDHADAAHGRGQSPVAYQLHWADKTVLFSGRIPNQAKAEIELELFSEISKIARERRSTT